MRPQLPKIAEFRDRGTCGQGGNVISRITRCTAAAITGVVQDHFDLGNGKTGQLHFEVKLDQSLQFDGQNIAVPSGLLGEPIISQDIGTLLNGRQMGHRQDRHFSEAKVLCGREAAMAGNDLILRIDKDRGCCQRNLGCSGAGWAASLVG